MYYCLSCKSEFEKPDVHKETHGLSSPPYETVCRCSNCGGSNFEEKRPFYCKCCGARLGFDKKAYCSEKCRIRGEEMRRRELKRRKERYNSDINRILRELDRYNAEHNTDYSYGQYVAIIRPDLKRKRKNEQ